MSVATSDALSSKLAELHAAKLTRDRHKALLSEAEAAFRRLEAEVIETMLSSDPPLTSIRVEGLGQFVIQSRTYITPQDYVQVVTWAAADGLIEADNDGTGEGVTVYFKPLQEVDEDTGEISVKLVSGAFKLDASKATLSAHAKDKLDGDNVELPGLKTSVTRFIQLRK